jgi:hypothetical protein
MGLGPIHYPYFRMLRPVFYIRCVLLFQFQNKHLIVVIKHH